MSVALVWSSIRWWVLVLYATALRLPFDGDFRGMRLAAASAAAHGWAWVYDPSKFQQVTRAAGIGNFVMLNPPILPAVIVPVSRIPWPLAAWIWLAANALLFAGGLWLVSEGAPTSRRLVLAIAAFGFFPVFEALGEGNDSAIAFFGVALAYRLARDGRDAPAGFALALGLFKPQMLFLLPVAIVAAGRWRLFAWSIVGVVTASVVSVLLVGPAAVEQWILTIVQGRAHVKLLNGQVNTLAYYLPATLRPLLVVAAAIAVAYVARSRRHSPHVVSVVFGVGLLASLLATPYADPQEFSALLIVGWLFWLLWPRPLVAAGLVLAYAGLTMSFLYLPSPVPLVELAALVAVVLATRVDFQPLAPSHILETAPATHA